MSGHTAGVGWLLVIFAMSVVFWVAVVVWLILHFAM